MKKKTKMKVVKTLVIPKSAQRLIIEALEQAAQDGAENISVTAVIWCGRNETSSFRGQLFFTKPDESSWKVIKRKPVGSKDKVIRRVLRGTSMLDHDEPYY